MLSSLDVQENEVRRRFHIDDLWTVSMAVALNGQSLQFVAMEHRSEVLASWLSASIRRR